MNRLPFLLGKSIVYEDGVSIDCDGSPRAYGPANNPGLDYLANAGSIGNYYGISCNSSGIPFIQTDTDPYPGMFVSTTALQDHNHTIDNPSRYVNSESVPYVSVSSTLIKQFGCSMGDLSAVYNRNNDTLAFAIAADVSPRGKYGEISICLANNIKIDSNPKYGGCLNGIITILFLNSKSIWPMNNSTIEEMGRLLLSQAGGILQYL